MSSSACPIQNVPALTGTISWGRFCCQPDLLGTPVTSPRLFALSLADPLFPKRLQPCNTINRNTTTNDDKNRESIFLFINDTYLSISLRQISIEKTGPKFKGIY